MGKILNKRKKKGKEKIMTKKEFMRELERGLSKIPENEKIDALNYYEDYFADAGIGDDRLVPESMGTPEEIAKQIIEEVVHKEETGEYFDENVDRKSESSEYIPYYKRGENNSSAEQRRNYSNSETYNTQTKGTDYKNNDAKVVAIILLVITSPIWGSIAIAVLSCIFAVVVALGAVVFGLGVSGIALVITAFLSSTFAGGFLLAGTGLILFAVAMLMIIPLVLFCVKFLPWVIGGIVKQCKRLFGNGKEQA